MSLNGWTVTFRGGPYGGETRYGVHPSDFVGGRMRVWVYSPIRSGIFTESQTLPSLPSATYAWEEYQLDGRFGKTDTPDTPHYVARWINPNEGLRRDNAKLRAHIFELERAKDALDAIDTLRTFFNNGF